MTNPDRLADPAADPPANPFAPPSTSRFATPSLPSLPAGSHRHAFEPGFEAEPGSGAWNAPTPSPAAGEPVDTVGPVDPAGRRGSSGPRRVLSVVWIAPLVVLALVAGAVGGVVAERVAGHHLADAGLPVAVSPGGAARPADSVAGLAARVLPSVVSIEVDGPQGTSTGSGLVLRQDGYLLTNNHVIAAGADSGARIVVLFVDGTKEPASIVGRTGAYDIAVIKVERTGLVPLVLGDSNDVAVGDPVVAVGAPLGLKGTVTTGIISALNRPVAAGDATDTAFINAIQTDAAINPGNSGGPLVNAAGEVIGINSAIAQPPGAGAVASGSIGLGFAIPSNQARRTAEQLIETGRATYPIVGVLLDQGYTGEGVQVATAPQQGQEAVSPGGPADNAGIRAGDIILAIDARPVTEPDELIVAIRAKAPGDTVTLRVRTGDRPVREVRVVLHEATSH